MNMKIVGISVSIVVTIIVLAGVLIPVLDDAEQSFTTLGTNEGGLYMVSTENKPIEFAYETDGYTLNGDVITSDYTSSAQMMIISDKFIAATNPLSGARTIYFATPGQTFKTVSALKCENGSVTYTSGTTDTTLDVGYSWIAYPANEGSYMYAGNLTSVNVDSKSDVIVGYLGPTYHTGESNLSTIIMAKGNLSSIVPGAYTGTTYTETAGSVYATYVEGTPNELTPSYGISVGSSDLAFTATTPNVFVPIDYHYYADSSDDMSALFGAIPVMIILAIILGVAGLILSKRN